MLAHFFFQSVQTQSPKLSQHFRNRKTLTPHTIRATQYNPDRKEIQNERLVISYLSQDVHVLKFTGMGFFLALGKRSLLSGFGFRVSEFRFALISFESCNVIINAFYTSAGDLVIVLFKLYKAFTQIIFADGKPPLDTQKSVPWSQIVFAGCHLESFEIISLFILILQMWRRKIKI